MILDILVVFVCFVSILGVIYNAFLMAAERNSSKSVWSSVFGVGALFCESCWTGRGNQYRLRMLFSLFGFICSVFLIAILSE